MYTVYLLLYNNYYNRLVKREDTIEDYIALGSDVVLGAIERVNFNPNDGINTRQVINWKGAEPDYLIVVDEYGEIVSRWYVMDSTRTTMGQYGLIIHRDVLADFRTEVLDSTAYIKKAMLPIDNMLIYNSEGMSFNQIKTREDLLYDKTGTPWIVGYVDATATDLQGATIDFSAPNAPLTNYSEILELSQNGVQLLDNTVSINFVSRYSSSIITKKYFRYNINYFTPNGEPTVTGIDYSPPLTYDDKGVFNQSADSITSRIIEDYTNSFRGQGQNILEAVATRLEEYTADNSFLALNDRVVHDTNSNSYYLITVKQSNTSGAASIGCSTARNSGLYYDFLPLVTAPLSVSSTNTSEFTIGIRYQKYNIMLTPITYGDRSVTLHDNARVLKDAPYRMFCMKYTEENCMLAINLATNNGTKVYDVQVLPYCPVQDYFNDDGSFKGVSILTAQVDYEPITPSPSSSTVLDYLFWCDTSTDTFDIEYKVDINDIKQAVECDLYRLCSPNGNGQFEFNAARNGGISYINVDFTYRPYDPYIHLNPNFGNLYGQDFNDFRGLVLNGDFSIPAIADKWAEYTIQNKNYQNIFNREIQSLELQQNITRKQEKFAIAAGTLQGGASGAASGAMVGGAYGAIAGAIVGTATSAAGGALDYKNNEQLRQDQLTFKYDIFDYSLRNIQALPQSVSKTGCLTNNNKLVPYVEYYTCTDEEKAVLAAKIKYTGMTVGACGKIEDFILLGQESPQYLEADIIELKIAAGYHIAMEISKEIQIGVRFV